MRYPNVTSLYSATALAFNASTEEFPWDDLRKILHEGQSMAKVQKAKNIAKILTPPPEQGAQTLQTTDRRQTELRWQRPERNVVAVGQKSFHRNEVVYFVPNLNRLYSNEATSWARQTYDHDL